MEISYEGEKIRLTKADVLSLDIATHTGYHSIHGSGTWDFTEAKYRNNNKQHKAFRYSDGFYKRTPNQASGG